MTLKDQSFLTLDSGGSKTTLVLYNLNGSCIKKETAPGYGTVSDSDSVIKELSELLTSFCDGYDIVNVICNLGGKNKAQMVNTLQSAFPKAQVHVFRESEGLAGITLCKMYSAEVMLMAGTGSIAIAQVTEDKTIISGGWGANIGDKGSGYSLGLDAVRLVLEELDGVSELSEFAKAFTGFENPPLHLSAEEYCAFRDGIRKKLGPFDRAGVARHAKTVFSLAEKGDKTATKLYEKVGLDLADVVLSAAKKSGKNLVNAVVTGGMVKAKKFWQASFEETLKKHYDVKNIFYIDDGIDIAMCEIAKNMKEGENLCFPKDL